MGKTMRVPFFQALYVLLLAITLQGCNSLGYGDVDIDTTRKAIVAANAEIRGANLLLQDLIQRRAISQAQAQSAKDALQQAKDGLQIALNAVDVGRVRAALDSADDVVIVDASVEAVEFGAADAAVVDAYVRRVGWNQVYF